MTPPACCGLGRPDAAACLPDAWLLPPSNDRPDAAACLPDAWLLPPSKDRQPLLCSCRLTTAFRYSSYLGKQAGWEVTEYLLPAALTSGSHWRPGPPLSSSPVAGIPVEFPRQAAPRNVVCTASRSIRFGLPVPLVHGPLGHPAGRIRAGPTGVNMCGHNQCQRVLPFPRSLARCARRAKYAHLSETSIVCSCPFIEADGLKGKVGGTKFRNTQSEISNLHLVYTECPKNTES